MTFDSEHAIGPYAQYLFVTNDKEGTESVMEIDDDEPLDLEALIVKWIQREYGDNKTCGDYYASIITDWNPKDTAVIWEGAYFFIRVDE